MSSKEMPPERFIYPTGDDSLDWKQFPERLETPEGEFP
jgi:hypothetical protein